MKKLPLLAIGAAALAIAGFASAASAHERDHVSFGIVVGAPPVFVEDRGYDSDRYWAHRRWEERRRWEEHRRWEERRWEREHWRHERWERRHDW